MNSGIPIGIESLRAAHSLNSWAIGKIKSFNSRNKASVIRLAVNWFRLGCVKRKSRLSTYSLRTRHHSVIDANKFSFIRWSWSLSTMLTKVFSTFAYLWFLFVFKNETFDFHFKKVQHLHPVNNMRSKSVWFHFYLFSCDDHHIHSILKRWVVNEKLKSKTFSHEIKACELSDWLGLALLNWWLTHKFITLFFFADFSYIEIV